MAAIVDLSPGALGNIINGSRRPSWQKAKTFAAATKTTPELWLEGTPEQMRNAIGALTKITEAVQ